MSSAMQQKLVLCSALLTEASWGPWLVMVRALTVAVHQAAERPAMVDFKGRVSNASGYVPPMVSSSFNGYVHACRPIKVALTFGFALRISNPYGMDTSPEALRSTSAATPTAAAPAPASAAGANNAAMAGQDNGEGVAGAAEGAVEGTGAEERPAGASAGGEAGQGATAAAAGRGGAEGTVRLQPLHASIKCQEEEAEDEEVEEEEEAWEDGEEGQQEDDAVSPRHVSPGSKRKVRRRFNREHRKWKV